MCNPPPQPTTTPTLKDLFIRMRTLLLAAGHDFAIYHQHFELERRKLISTGKMDVGVTIVYPILSTQELRDLHELLIYDTTPLDPVYTEKDYERLLNAIDMVFKPGSNREEVFTTKLNTHLRLILMFREERGKRGLTKEDVCEFTPD